MSYSIGQVAKLMNISTFTLRYYDNSGLFPFIKRDESGKRIFEESDLEFLGVIYCLKQTGMTIPQIKNFIEMTQKGSDSFKDRYNMFVSRREAIDEQIQELLTYRECIDFKCDYYSKAIKANSEEKLIENQDKFPLYKIIELNQKEDKK